MAIILKVVNRILSDMRMLPCRIRYKVYASKYEVANKFFRGVDTIVYGQGKIIAGERSYCGERCGFQLAVNHKIEIGVNVSISHNVRVYTESDIADSVIAGSSVRARRYGDVSIGDNSWIGANVFINPGISIGRNVVIGANSVVTRDIPDCVVAAGCPARIIKTYNVDSQN